MLEMDREQPVRMKTFLTEMRKEDGLYRGPNLRAYTWIEAEGICARLEGITIAGIINE